MAKAKLYLHHKWLARFTRRQFHLDCDNFLGLCEAVLLADYSTAMVLGSGYKSTCETDATANLYVVLVLYKKDGETKCDYVRFWASAATSAEFHHKAMHVAAKHLKGLHQWPHPQALSRLALKTLRALKYFIAFLLPTTPLVSCSSSAQAVHKFFILCTSYNKSLSGHI